MGGILITFAASFSDALSFFRQIGASIAANPVRTVFICLGVALIISAFWDDILDAAGIQSNERLLTKINSWLHFTFGYSLIETKRHGETFTVIAEYKNTRFTITKDERWPTLSVTSELRADEFKELVAKTSNSERVALREDLALELLHLKLHSLAVTFQDDVFQTTVSSKIILNKDFDEFQLMAGIGEVRRGIDVTKQILGRWARQRRSQQSK